ncbi:MAG: glycosyltransferase [Acidobacteriota bacterium]
MTPPRVAFFPDSFLEVNGVARTCRELAAHARSQGLPLLCVHAGPETRRIENASSVSRLQLRRGLLSFGLERDLRFDLGFWRHRGEVAAALRAFEPDVIHITGPSDLGQLGALMAHQLRVPLVASWHTNVHDFAARRLSKLAGWLPASARGGLTAAARRQSLSLTLDFYKMAAVILAPNGELEALLRGATRRPVHPMTRGVDTRLFAPHRRTASTDVFRIGYVGRLSPEKSVRQLAELEAMLAAATPRPFSFTIVGDGSERAWLERHMRRAEFAGVLAGEKLARAYANMDLFVFPSRTDTYGNVVQEAMACGTPVAVTDEGGPKYLVDPGVNGFVAPTLAGFRHAVLALIGDPNRAAGMRAAARARAEAASWDRVFGDVWTVYRSTAAGVTRVAAATELSGLARLVTTIVGGAGGRAGRPGRRRRHPGDAMSDGTWSRVAGARGRS